MLEIPQNLVAADAIARLKARYFRTLDTADWAGYAEIFSDDARLDLNESNARFADYGFTMQDTLALKGGKEIAAYVANALVGFVTTHHGHMPEIDILSPTTARGIWALEDTLENPTMLLRGSGHYHEEYRLTDAGWRIARLRLSRLRMEFYSRDPDGQWRSLAPCPVKRPPPTTAGENCVL